MPVRLLRVLSTVLLAFAIGQAGFGSGIVGGNADLTVVHFINSFLVVGMVVACLVGGVLYKQAGGPVWPVLFAAALLVVAVVQIILGRSGIVGAHVFLGVLYLCAVTTFCSYVWRHQPKVTFEATA